MGAAADDPAAATLHAGILVLASVGAYSVNRSIFDVGLLYAIGVAGYLMRAGRSPLAPAVIGLILGPMAEQQLRRSLAIAQGDPRIFVSRPLSAVLLLLAVVALIGPRLIRRFAVPSAPTS